MSNFIEELYEVVEAIEEKDDEALCEELGDLMLHIVFQAQIAREHQAFEIEDVLKDIPETSSEYQVVLDRGDDFKDFMLLRVESMPGIEKPKMSASSTPTLKPS